MLVCNVSLRPPRAGIAADIAEVLEATDATATGQVVFATLVDDPASVGDLVDAYLGEIMVEAASADATADAGLSYDAAVDEAVTAADTPDATAGAPPVGPDTILTGLIGWWDASVTASLTLSSGGTKVDAVADLSGAGNNLTWVSSRADYNATGFNSRPAIVFDHDALENTSFPMGAGNTLTVFYVGTVGSGLSDNHGRFFSYRAPGQTTDYANVPSWNIANPFTANHFRFTRNSVDSTGNASVYPAPHRLVITISSAGQCKIYVDGTVTTGGTAAGNWVTGGILAIGRNAGGTGEYVHAPFAEFGIATGFSDATTVAALDTYLQNKWGL